MLLLLPGLILAPCGWAAGWLCHRPSEVAALCLPACALQLQWARAQLRGYGKGLPAERLCAASWAASCQGLGRLGAAEGLLFLLALGPLLLLLLISVTAPGKPVPKILRSELLHLLSLLAPEAGCSSSVLGLGCFPEKVALSGKLPVRGE